MDRSPIRSGMAAAGEFGYVMQVVKRWAIAAFVCMAVLGVTWAVWGASTTIPERAQALCGHDDCTTYVQHIKGSKRRLTIVVNDSDVSFGTLTHRLYTDAGAGQVCGNCSMPTEMQAADIQFMINALIWQTSSPTWQGELRSVCGDKMPVIYKVYPNSVVVVDHSEDTNATSFQVDVRVGCI